MADLVTGGTSGGSGAYPGGGGGGGSVDLVAARAAMEAKIKASMTTQVPPAAVHPAVATHLSLMAELKALLVKIETNLFHLHAATAPAPAPTPPVTPNAGS